MNLRKTVETYLFIFVLFTNLMRYVTVAYVSQMVLQKGCTGPFAGRPMQVVADSGHLVRGDFLGG